MNDQIHVVRAVTNSADEFESVVQPVAGAVRIKPKYRSRFSSSINVARLRRLGMVLMDIDPMHTLIEPQYNFYCLSVPIINPCHIKDISSRREYSRHKAHLLYPDRALDCHHSGKSRLLGVAFMIDNLDDIARKLFGNTSALRNSGDSIPIYTRLYQQTEYVNSPLISVSADKIGIRRVSRFLAAA